MTDVCLSKKDVKRLGRLLEDQLCDVRDVIEESDLSEKAKADLFDKNEDKLQTLFIKVKKCSCNPPENIDEWENQFRKGAYPWA